MNEVEQLVIKNLLLEEEYVRKALPFIKSEYFADLTVLLRSLFLL